MKANLENVTPGTEGAIAEIYRRCEARLADALKPAVLAPIGNYSQRNGMAASAAVIAEIRRVNSSSAVR